ncbi:ubiquitinyl hydrolase [Yamadazyma tenuis]|uniref:Ubiquitin carboxyl-terminal hydrolase n=1 Tax=Candida tenuis (strain ATCC 10573 / BCRC 21748 / CBS 615 / JCM 9827 / NBRC 10315 / NRRL Y-1498 / VKM Y-70) TaxID=590646 RepID=G3BDB8_CANTC|nr:ubiquitinyl hydrolase [Yamadazyma tenuis ATCC 10573]XP_006690525.1 uncharacterized protein CANTEDRAFT_116981 [Yamadazyma tenuis ATCC 10573]EGV61310.1 ubiquitinyl hydrolase [Yamadazyma tenuis ATCC 10573]EGV61311.1 hypothetical protein CANTEDRAFT_116981 [Yamadazyma tenuis ATCC 10573]WEJ93806.1 ubiquitinyl hydrolase [Yamadazyma tenuis]
MASSGWNTIDSDAGVFTRLVEKLNVKDVQFEDLYSIDSDSLRALSPIYGVIFLFKYSAIDRQYALDNNAPLAGEYDQDFQQYDIFFANQTIQNACATQAVLNILLNQIHVDVGEDLANFKSFVTGFDPLMAGETISNSDLIRSVHNSFSTPSILVDEDPSKPPPDSDHKNDGLFHFVGYVNVNGYIYELDGLKDFPIRHCSCSSQDEFIDKIPSVLMERISKYKDELRFSTLVITNNKLKQYKEIGDSFMVESEINKRDLWDREIELRKHDYTNLFVKIVKDISSKSSDQDWHVLLDKARQKSKRRLM